MSWIVQNLLTNSLKIRSEADIESDEFNDLLLIEKAVQDLKKMGTLTEYEISLIEMLSDGSYKKDVSRSLGKNRRVIIKNFDAVCDRVAFYLGGYFTDEGYIHYIAKKYKLEDEKVEAIRVFIKSKHRHRNIKRKFVENKETL